MLIKCEKCSVLYEVPDERLILERPRLLKCSACGNVFEAPKDDSNKENVISDENIVPAVEQTDAVPMALSEIFKQEDDKTEKDYTQENPETSEVSLFEPLESAEEFTPIEENHTKHSRFLWLFLILIACILLFYVGRFFFVRQTPIAEKLYKKVGVETSILGEGLAFQNTVFDLQKNAVNYELLVKSEIFNTTDETKSVPMVVVRLLDSRGKIVQSQNIYLEKSILDAGTTLPFETRLKTLSDKARHIEITFERNKN